MSLPERYGCCGPREGNNVYGSRCVANSMLSHKKSFAEAPLKTKHSPVHRMQNLITNQILLHTGCLYIVAIKPSRHPNRFLCMDTI